MTAEARLVKLETDYYEAVYLSGRLQVDDPRFKRWDARTGMLDRAIRETLPAGPEGLMVRWRHLRLVVEALSEDELALREDLDAFEAALRYVIGRPA